MLHSLKDLEGYTIGATDGEVGHVKDFYFDDHAWAVRYLVVETGDWLKSRKVLISPHAIQHLKWTDKTLPAAITQAQVRNSPDIDTDKPISRQHEIQYLSYYGYPYYWDSVSSWGGGLTPDMFPVDSPATDAARHDQQKAQSVKLEAQHHDDDPHLRSCKAVAGYHVHAVDGEIGKIDGFLIDDVDWSIRYLIVNTSNWWLGHQVLIAPQWFKDVNWADSEISTTLGRDSVMEAPPYFSAEAVNRALEADLYSHYKQMAYWTLDGASPGLSMSPDTRRAL